MWKGANSKRQRKAWPSFVVQWQRVLALLIIYFKTATIDYETDALLNVRQNRIFFTLLVERNYYYYYYYYFYSMVWRGTYQSQIRAHSSALRLLCRQYSTSVSANMKLVTVYILYSTCWSSLHCSPWKKKLYKDTKP